RRGPDRGPGADPRRAARRRRAAADEPGVDDLWRGAGDRADHRRLDPGLGPLVGDLLVPGRVRAAADAGGVCGAAGNAPAAAAPVAGAAAPAARLLGDLRQPALPAAGGLGRVQLQL